VCGINNVGHKCDEYSVLFAKSGMKSRVAMLGSDRIDFSTRVPTASGTWVPAVLPYRIRH
jgi:hypothetical protein